MSESMAGKMISVRTERSGGTEVVEQAAGYTEFFLGFSLWHSISEQHWIEYVYDVTEGLDIGNTGWVKRGDNATLFVKESSIGSVDQKQRERKSK